MRKLSAGHGYDYLIRQVAVLDATHWGRTDLASYYMARGETPGRWVGRGLDGIDGLAAGDVVTADQMRLLFAEGRHPLAGTSPPAAGGQVLALGAPYRAYKRQQRRYGSGSRTTTLGWGFPRTPRCRRESGRGSAASLQRSGSAVKRAANRATIWSCSQP